MASHDYGGAIWTNHALQRLSERGLSQAIAWDTFKYPDKVLEGKKTGTTEYQKRVGNSLATIIATQNEKKEWIILSCWIDPPLPGSIDHKKYAQYKNYQKASGFKKFLLILKQQLGW